MKQMPGIWNFENDNPYWKRWLLPRLCISAVILFVVGVWFGIFQGFEWITR